MSAEEKKPSRRKVFMSAVLVGLLVGLVSGVVQVIIFGESNPAINGGIAGACAAAAAVMMSKKTGN